MTDRIAEYQGVYLRLWKGPGLLTDYRSQTEAQSVADSRGQEKKPFLAMLGVHAMSGLSIPYMPAPFAEESVSVAGVFDDHRRQFLAAMSRMLYGLHDPVLWRGSARERLLPVTTYDLRMTNGSADNHGGNLRFFLLAKAFVPIDRATDEERAVEAACRQAVQAIQMCYAQSPASLTLRPLRWREPEGYAAAESVTAEDVGIRGPFVAFGEVRRANYLTTLRTETDYKKFCDMLHEGHFFAAPEPWPASRHGLVATCNYMAAAPQQLLLSVRVQPTVRTQNEHEALIRFLEEKPEEGVKRTRRVGAARKLRARLWRTRELYLTHVEVAGETESAVRELLATYVSEFASPSSGHGGRDVLESLGQRPARVLALNDHEREIAKYNLQQLEFLPWGGVSEKVLAAAHPAGTSPRGLPNLQGFLPTDDLRLPDTFLQRDLELNPRLARLRKLLSVSEVSSVWQVPVATRLGQAGYVCQLASPFSQGPVATAVGDRSVNFGRIVRRSLVSDVAFQCPAFESTGDLPRLADYLMVVAGGPRTGKTIFVRTLLRQLAYSTSRFMVLDLKGHGEFRGLTDASGSKIRSIRIGSKAHQGAAFNPFSFPTLDVLPFYRGHLTEILEASGCASRPLSDLLGEAINRAVFDVHRIDVTQRNGGVATSLDAISAVMGNGEKTADKTLLGELVSSDERLRLTCEWSRLREYLACFFGEPAQGAGELSDLAQVPTIIEFPGYEEHELTRVAFAFFIAWIRAALKPCDKTVPLVLAIDDYHVIESRTRQESQVGSRADPALLADCLGPLEYELQVMILVDQNPKWLRHATSLRRPIFPVQFRPNIDEESDGLAPLLQLTRDQRQYLHGALSVGEMIVIEPRLRFPLVIRCVPDS